MKALFIISCDLPAPDCAVEVVTALDPPNIPHFAGEVRIVVEPHATVMEEWLDVKEDEDVTSK